MNATNHGIHDVGIFFPWHRLAVWKYESTLRSECNYTGTQPFWNWELDTLDYGRHFNASPVIMDLEVSGLSMPIARNAYSGVAISLKSAATA